MYALQIVQNLSTNGSTNYSPRISPFLAALSKSKCNNERVGIGERSLGRLNDVSFYGDGVRTEAQRWQVVLLSRSGKSYTV